MAFVGDRVEDFARERSDLIALRSESHSLTWAAFESEVRAVEAELDRKTSARSRIAVVCQDPVRCLAAFFACARSGRIAMVMDPDWPPARLAALQDVAAAVARIDDRSYPSCDPIALSEPNSRSAGDPSEAHEFYAGFTSGSTGTPKGFVRTHGSWLASFQVSDQDLDARSTGEVVIAGGLSHSLHLYGAVHALARGLTVTVFPRFDPRRIAATLSGARSKTALYATPTQLQLLIGLSERHGGWGGISFVLSSGAKWPEAARQQFAGSFPQASLIEFYGSSEASFVSFARSGDGTPPGSVGRPEAPVELAIGDPLAPGLPGIPGPIWVRSPLLFSGYLTGQDPVTRWCGDWLTFGDHGYLDSDGYLFLTGRENRMIITSGLNVYPEEIETALAMHPDVAAAVVFGRPDRIRGQRLEAVIAPRPGSTVCADTLRRYCRDQVGSSKTPRRFHWRDVFPLTAGGKPDLQRLLAELSGAEDKKTGGVDP